MLKDPLHYKKLLRSHGLRATPLRIALVEFLSSHHGPFTIRELQERLNRSGNITTFYRATEALVENGLVVTCDFGDGSLRYEMAQEKDHHHHIVCTSCGRWQRIPICIGDQATQELEKTGFKEVSHKLEFFGICPACAERGGR